MKALVVETAPWDGKDGVLPAVDGDDDSTSKDEL